MGERQDPLERLYAIIQHEGLGGLTEAELGFFGVYWFVLETNNGGIHQFFFNDSGQLARPALGYLERIGAAATASTLRQAIALFPGGEIPTDQKERRELLLSLDQDCVLFDSLTDELFSCLEDVNDCHETYVSANPTLFMRLRGDGNA